jgi:hypothetical protein
MGKECAACRSHFRLCGGESATRAVPTSSIVEQQEPSFPCFPEQ